LGEVSVMKRLPANSEVWISLVSFPFKAYLVVAPLLFLFWQQFQSDAYPRGVRADFARYIDGGFIVCIGFFLVAATVQFWIRKRGAALQSFLYAVAFFAARLLWPAV
jgi:hypothetical protein